MRPENIKLYNNYKKRKYFDFLSNFFPYLAFVMLGTLLFTTILKIPFIPLISVSAATFVKIPEFLRIKKDIKEEKERLIKIDKILNKVDKDEEKLKEKIKIEKTLSNIYNTNSKDIVDLPFNFIGNSQIIPPLNKKITNILEQLTDIQELQKDKEILLNSLNIYEDILIKTNKSHTKDSQEFLKILEQATNDFEEIINQIDNKLKLFNEEKINESLMKLKVNKRKL